MRTLEQVVSATLKFISVKGGITDYTLTQTSGKPVDRVEEERVGLFQGTLGSEELQGTGAR